MLYYVEATKALFGAYSAHYICTEPVWMSCSVLIGVGGSFLMHLIVIKTSNDKRRNGDEAIEDEAVGNKISDGVEALTQEQMTRHAAEH